MVLGTRNGTWDKTMAEIVVETIEKEESRGGRHHVFLLLAPHGGVSLKHDFQTSFLCTFFTCYNLQS